MGVVNAFLATWSNARSTLGEGTPQGGAQFDNSGQLQQLQSTVESAAPGARWTGSAADAYADTNSDHGRVLGHMAGLDQRLGAEVDRSAAVIAAGRRDMDSVRQWVLAAASTVPQTPAGERMLLPVVGKGASEIAEILQRSHGDLSAIGGRIRDIGNEYQLLGKPKEKGPDGKPGDDASPPDRRKQAEQDVKDALAGDKEAAKRVAGVLDSITPGNALTPQQGSYLSQMQAQQNGMSISDLKTAEQRLGDQKHIVADSWQLMSNKNVSFPKTELKVGALDEPSSRVQGGINQLPKSVRDALNEPDISGADRVQVIADVVKDGHPALQQNTDLDRGLLQKSATMMDTQFWPSSEKEMGINVQQRVPWLDPVVSDVFSAVSPDHQAIHDAVTGHISGVNQEKFLEGITHRAWADGGAGAGSLFSWAGDVTTGPEAKIGAETAQAYSQYLGQHGSNLLDLPGHHALGQVDAKLVQAFAHGLTPYVGALVGDGGATPDFTPIDDLGGSMSHTRNLFAVIDSDPDAARSFNGAAYRHVMDYEDNFARAAAADPNLGSTDPRITHLANAGRLLGVIDGGAHLETTAHKDNSLNSAVESAKRSYEMRRLWLDTALANVPGGDRVADMTARAMLGPEPSESDIPHTGNYVTDTGLSASQLELAHAGAQLRYDIAAGLVHGSDPHIEHRFFNPDGSLMSPGEVVTNFGQFGWDAYKEQLNTYLAQYPSLTEKVNNFQWTFGSVGGIGPQQPPK